MSDEEVIEKVGKITRNKGNNPLADAQQIPEARVEPNREKFEESLRTDTSNQARKVEKNNLLDEVRSLSRQVDNAERATPAELADQSRGVIAQIEEIKHRLSDPNLEIKSDYKRILRNKLEHIDEHLKVALDKAGVQYIPPELIDGTNKTPVERFLNMLTSGQDQLKTLGGDLATIGANKESISPASLLMVQVKVNSIQQELEFFTSLLNKALESTKTIMNVQV
ncbi:MAG: hypothetical protein AAGG81_03510 [Chlamydiota bacterium]